MQDTTDVAELEQGFVVAARAYSERRGIGYAAWREAGVSASVLKKASAVVVDPGDAVSAEPPPPARGECS